MPTWVSKRRQARGEESRASATLRRAARAGSPRHIGLEYKGRVPEGKGMNGTETDQASGTRARLTSAQKRDLALTGAPPLVWGEERGTYDQLMADVFNTMDPKHILELIELRNYVDLEWEIARMRRAKANIVNAAKVTALITLLSPMFPSYPSDAFDGPVSETLATQWSKGDQAAMAEVEKLLTEAGLTNDDVIAQAILIKLRELEHIDLITMRLEARRDSMMRELLRHRAAAEASRRSKAQVVDAEYRDVTESPAAPGHAA